MYRYLISVLLCASAVMPAPQQNSNITYVKLQPDLEQTQPVLNPLQRESRIEKVPLTIPAVVATQPTESIETTKATQTVNKQPTYNYSDRIYSIKTKLKTTTSTEKNVDIDEVNTESVTSGDKNITQENPETNNSDIVPAESILNDRVATNDSTGLSIEADTTQTDEFVTEKYEEDTTVTITTVIEEETTRAPIPRQLPKLSYFGKSITGSFSQNLIAHPDKRRFRSRCRCEKIWNCTKLQITVPRCPEEYFLCC